VPSTLDITWSAERCRSPASSCAVAALLSMRPGSTGESSGASATTNLSSSSVRLARQRTQ